MLRMSYEDFKKLLNSIEQHITPYQVNGGNKVITAPATLPLTLRFLATGERFKSRSFQFRISNRTVSYIIKQLLIKQRLLKCCVQFTVKNLERMNSIKLPINLVNSGTFQMRPVI